MGDWGEMKQGQIETVTITFMGEVTMPSFLTSNLVAQYNTPSYYHKTFQNKLNWKNLAAKTVFFLHSLSKLSNFKKN